MYRVPHLELVLRGFGDVIDYHSAVVHSALITRSVKLKHAVLLHSVFTFANYFVQLARELFSHSKSSQELHDW